jgi:hypothetical protein
MSKSFIPAAEAVFHVWQSNLLSKLVENATKWNIPDSAITALLAQQTHWNAIYAEAENPATRTKGAVKEKQDTRKEYETELRSQLKAYVTYNPLIDNRQREDMGLPVHKTTHSPAPVAPNAPWMRPNTGLLRHVTFDYGGSETSKAKPDGQHGLEMAWSVAAEKPAHVRDLAHSTFDTRSPLTLEFEEEERGQTLWYASRWENTRGEKGPWSEIQSIIIP